MTTESINAKIEYMITLKWWNPISWVVTLLAPFFGLFMGILVGCFVGLLVGFQKGLAQSLYNVEHFLAEIR